jgi:hypothetical protein
MFYMTAFVHLLLKILCLERVQIIFATLDLIFYHLILIPKVNPLCGHLFQFCLQSLLLHGHCFKSLFFSPATF